MGDTVHEPNYKGQTIFTTPRKPMNVRNKTAWQSARILLDSCYTTCSEITIHQLGGQHLYGVVMLDHHDLHSHKRNGLQMNFHSYQVVTFDSHTYIPPYQCKYVCMGFVFDRLHFLKFLCGCTCYVSHMVYLYWHPIECWVLMEECGGIGT